MGFLTLSNIFLTPISKRLAQVVYKLLLAVVISCHVKSPRLER